MKVVFRLSVDAAEKSSVGNAINVLEASHAERLAYGEQSSFPFNSDQSIWHSFDHDGDIVVVIDGQRCPLLQNGLLSDFKAFVAGNFGAGVVQLLDKATTAIGDDVGGVTCLEYVTSDSRLKWDQSLADWYTENPKSQSTFDVFAACLHNGDLYFNQYCRKGRIDGSIGYSATEAAAIYAVLNLLPEEGWQARADAVAAFKEAKEAMIDACWPAFE